jgi:hypothetical protein
MPKGNTELQKSGATPLPEADLAAMEDLPQWLREHTPTKLVERDLFG